jgi:hypothetical protein
MNPMPVPTDRGREAASGPAPVALPLFRRAALVGLGALGGEIADCLVPSGLLSGGVEEFLLIDPKRYGPDNVGRQCAGQDVDRPKVEVVAERLRASGARVESFAGYVEDLPPGRLGPDALVVASADRLSAGRSAHNLALLLGLRLLRVQIEPTYDLAQLQFFDYARPVVESCLECQWGPKEYREQQNVHTCDGREGRPTRSSRALARMAAGWAVTTLFARAANGETAHLHGLEIRLAGRAPGYVETTLAPNPACLCPHLRPALVRLERGPDAFTLRDLAREAGVADRDRIRVSGSGRFVTGSRCAACRHMDTAPRWIQSATRPVGRCTCGGDLYPIPFFTASRLDRDVLGAVWERPLDSLGVPSRAALLIRAGPRETAFILA